jgi:hypothetical protein
MTEPAPEFTPEAIAAALVAADFVPYRPSDRNHPEGFALRPAELIDAIVVTLRGVDLLEDGGPGSWPRALVNRYAQVLERAGYSVRVVVDDVIVTAKED